MIRYHVVPMNDIAANELSAWSNIQQQVEWLDSPYFRPEYSQAVAAIRDDVYVCVIEDGNNPVGFFPFQRTSLGMGVPVGGPLSDFHGVISTADAGWNVRDLLRACRLSSWDFNHLVVEQPQFQPSHLQVDDSPYMDLSMGLEHYIAERNAAGTDEVRQAMRKLRKLERELGPVRFVPHTTDPVVFEQLMSWKQDQYLSCGVTNVLAFPWVRSLLLRILCKESPLFAGMLSAVYVGDHLISAHLGMRTDKVLHAWFPAYDKGFSRWSPGTLLMILMAQGAGVLSLKRMDLGKGPEEYKRRLMSGARRVATGSVESQSSVRMIRQAYRNTRDWVRASPLRSTVQGPATMIRKFREWMAFQ